MAKKAPCPAMMANYYEKLTRIFLMSGDTLNHAAELLLHHRSPCALGRWQPWHGNEPKGYPLRISSVAAVARQ
ncbi:hypothetical protein R3P38DRAFT_3164344 [Favolaschia claudopus]|uniref:eIF3a PCI domain-containing protein n=1 Tax=Favolaschia claudopus TaxID=2862362 RepID=A0AAW0EFC5_9AGAR